VNFGPISRASIFKDPNNLQHFLKTFDWFLEQIKQA